MCPTYKLRVTVNEMGCWIQRGARSDPSHPPQRHLKGKTIEAGCSLPNHLYRSTGCATGGTSGLMPVWIFFLVTSALQLPLTWALHTYLAFS